MRVLKLLAILALIMMNVACSKNIKSYMIGYWALDSISYKGINYMDSMAIKQIHISDNFEIIFPINSQYRLDDSASFTSGWGKYYTVSEKDNFKVIFKTCYFEFNGEHQLEIRNDTLRHYMLMIIKSKSLFIRAVRLNFTYDSPSGLKIVEDFEKWPKKGEYQFVPLPDSVLR